MPSVHVSKLAVCFFASMVAIGACAGREDTPQCAKDEECDVILGVAPGAGRCRAGICKVIVLAATPGDAGGD